MKAHKPGCHLGKVSYHPSTCDCPDVDVEAGGISAFLRTRGDQLATEHAWRTDAFIRKEMVRLGLGHFSAQEARDHGWVLETRQGFPYRQPIRLYHEPSRDIYLQLCDY